jgi:hypothetical protein
MSWLGVGRFFDTTSSMRREDSLRRGHARTFSTGNLVKRPRLEEFGHTLRNQIFALVRSPTW